VTSTGNGKDTIYGTVGNGLVALLRGALAFEKLDVINDNAVYAAIGGLIDLKNQGDLGYLNNTDYNSSYELKSAETTHHATLTDTYDTVSKFFATINVNSKAKNNYIASKIPTDFSKAALGASKIVVSIGRGCESFLDKLNEMAGRPCTIFPEQFEVTMTPEEKIQELRDGLSASKSDFSRD
jgi:hypothetical protein